MNIEDDAMTPEERAFERGLAQRLARLGPQREPSPALDARILAAAHAAAQTRAAPARRRKPAKWPAVFGIAASLAFALGVAWKLRPLPPPVVATQESAAVAEDPLADYAPPPPAQVYAPRPRRVLEVPAPPPTDAPARTRGAGPAKARVAPRNTTANEPPFVFEAAPAPATAPALPSAPDAASTAGFAPPPPAPEAAGNAAAAAQSAADVAPQRREAADASAAPATQEVRTQQARKAAAPAAAPVPMQEADSAAADEEVVPPATADSPQVREAWLQRIRELAKAGRFEDARASLKEFRHRYPGTPLPDDLRALAE